MPRTPDGFVELHNADTDATWVGPLSYAALNPAWSPVDGSVRVDGPGGTVASILAYVGDDADRARAALDVEQASPSPRTTLVDRLSTIANPTRAGASPMAVLPASVRYANFDTTVVHFLPTIADANLAATRAEITAGTNLTGEVSDVSGFNLSGGTIDAPDLLSEFVSKVPGRTSAEDSSITFYASENGTDVRSILPYKTVGYIVWMHGGDVPSTGKMDVWPVRVTNPGTPTVSVGDELAKVMVGFAITREPKLNVAIPAAA